MNEHLDASGLPIWAAPERNKGPILEQLQRILPRTPGIFLEIASGTGQHLAHFAAALPDWIFQPSDIDPEHLRTLEQRRLALGLGSVRAPLALDVCAPVWPELSCDVIYCANMIHIAPWAASVGLFRFAELHLSVGQLLLTYGPYKIAGEHVAESNARFDESLRARNPEWGVRDLSALEEESARFGIRLRESFQLPANNFLIVWERC